MTKGARGSLTCLFHLPLVLNETQASNLNACAWIWKRNPICGNLIIELRNALLDQGHQFSFMERIQPGQLPRMPESLLHAPVQVYRFP